MFIQLTVQTISIDRQSSTSLSALGFLFSPVDQRALFLFEIAVRSIISCTAKCHSDGRRRLFEGDITTMGQIVSFSSSQSRVGSIQLRPDQFIAHGRSCSFCQESRYVRCVNDSYQSIL
ncbi:hypothetical protein DMUE_6314 [Dictyocoela muelleri]|nr:hypothetical protein DMUE_6314 [Dictyocoela muelleri]